MKNPFLLENVAHGHTALLMWHGRARVSLKLKRRMLGHLGFQSKKLTFSSESKQSWLIIYCNRRNQLVLPTFTSKNLANVKQLSTAKNEYILKMHKTLTLSTKMNAPSVLPQVIFQAPWEQKLINNNWSQWPSVWSGALSQKHNEHFGVACC